MAYKSDSTGPGGIASLPPTIGLTDRTPSSGAAFQGRALTSRWGALGNGNEGNGGGGGGGLALLPVGIGIALGALLYLAMTREHAPAGMAGLMANPGQGQRVTVRTHMRKTPGKRTKTRIKAYSYYK